MAGLEAQRAALQDEVGEMAARMAATQAARDEMLNYIAATHAELWQTHRAQLELHAQWRMERTNWLTALLKTAWNDGIGALEHPEQWASFAAWQVNWVIVSDAVPLAWFVALAASDTANRDQFRALLVWGVYSGIIVSRACSLIYHTFCELSDLLLYVDLFGICCMVLGAPFVYVEAYHVLGWDDVGLRRYLWVLCVAFTVTVALLPFPRWRQSALVLLACTGNFAAFKHHAAAVMWFGTGYICYRCNVPDRFLGHIQTRVYHSHVLWHLAVSVGQGLYMYGAMKFN